MKSQRKTRGHCRNARGEGTNPGAVVSRNHVVASPTDPMKSITYMIHDRLQSSYVPLSIFPCDERWNCCGKSFNHRGRKGCPVTTVDEDSKLSRRSDTSVVLQQSGIIGVWVVRWKRKHSICACFFGSLGHFDSQPLSETDSGDYRNASVDRMNRKFDNARVLGRR